MDTSDLTVAFGAALVDAFLTGAGLEAAALSSLLDPAELRALLRVARVEGVASSAASSARFRY
jgi:hypothetical protein